MHKGWIVAGLLGVTAGALLAGCCEPVHNLMVKGKNAIKDKFEDMKEQAQENMENSEM